MLGVPVPLMLTSVNNRNLVYAIADVTYGKVYLRDDGAGNILFCYAYGNTNAWTEDILIRSNAATGRLGVQMTIVDCAITVEVTGGANDHFHIAFVNSLGELYHCELIRPLQPTIAAYWTQWPLPGPGTPYQRVDNTSDAKTCSIDVDNAGDPHIAWNNNNTDVYYNYGPGNVFPPAANFSLIAVGAATTPLCVVVYEMPGAGRDVHVFWENANLIQWTWCDALVLPSNPVNWAAAVAVITHPGGTTAMPPSAYYWYEPGAALTQMMVGSCNTLGNTETNWYDEGNVNGWGGGWRGTTTEAMAAQNVQITQVDANDFAITYIPLGGGVPLFGFTNYGVTYDFLAATLKLCTNSIPNEMGAQRRARENSDFSYGILHTQAGVDRDLMFDLVRNNNKPTAVGLDPDSGDREDESNPITLSWTFTDPGQVQTQWSIEVDEYGTSFASPIWSSGIQAGAGGTDDIPALTLAFNTHYEWRIRVWDSEKGDEYDPYSRSDWQE